MARHIDNKTLGSIQWELTDTDNIHFLKAWGQKKKTLEVRAFSGPAKNEGPCSSLRLNAVFENVKMISKRIIKLY